MAAYFAANAAVEIFPLFVGAGRFIFGSATRMAVICCHVIFTDFGNFHIKFADICV